MRDAGYTATDAALRYVQTQSQCKWLSITNGDNIYGSDVFVNILRTKIQHGHDRVPDVVLSPLDSRNYADQGKLIFCVCYFLLCLCRYYTITVVHPFDQRPSFTKSLSAHI